MANPTAALHGTVKNETSNSATNTLVSDSGSVTAGQWLLVLIGGAFNDGGAGATDYTIAKTAGTATVGASVTPTSPGSAVASIAGNDGATYSFRTKAMYLPVTGSGTLTVTVTRSGASLDHGWAAAFVLVSDPGTIGAVGRIADNVNSASVTVTADAAPASTSLMLMAVFNNNGSGLITPPTGTTELSDTSLAAFGADFETAKQEGSASTANTFTALTTGGTGFGRAAISVEIAAAAGATAPAQVTGLAAVGKPGRATLSWTAPSNGGSAITDYLIERAPDVAGSPGTYATVADGTSTATAYTDTGLVNGLTYWYRVSAINAIGTGTASTAASASPTAHPWVEASNSEVGTAIGTANAIALPAGATTGDLIIAIVAVDLSATTTAITASTGWTAITNTNQVQGTSVVAMNAFARVLDGSGSDALAVSGSVSQDYVAQTYLIKAGDHGVTNATVNTTIVAAGTVGSSTNGNPPNDNPAVSKAWLWLTALALDLTTGTTITGIPASYTLLLNQVSASSTSSVALATAYRRLTASAEDPGTFTHVSRAWAAVTIAVPPVAALVASLGTAAETDTAGTWGRKHTKTLGAASETDSAGTWGRVHKRALGAASETDTAGQWSMKLGLNAALETDSAGAWGRRHTRALGVAQETDTAGAFGRRHLRALGAATEADTAGQWAMRLGLNPALETDTAGAWGRRHARSLGVATETDTAGPFGRLHTRALGAPAETDSAGHWGQASAALGPAAETDTAGTWGRSHRRALGPATETDTAGAFTRRHARQLGPVSETDTAGHWAKRLGLNPASELDQAGTWSHGNTKNLGAVAETDSAGTWVRVHARQLGAAAEVDAAGIWSVGHARALGAGLETDTAGPWGRLHLRAVGAALEQDAAGHWRRQPNFGPALEFDSTDAWGAAGGATVTFVGPRTIRRLDPVRTVRALDPQRSLRRLDPTRTMRVIS